MQKYSLPGLELLLLAELQKQQNRAQFCDTLLQTDGISVPTHSCILAALSPYLSRRLSASPAPPTGQKHQLQLEAVKAQTLLKLVGLLYSGELEVTGSVEENDMLALAIQLGIADLVEVQKDGGTRGQELQENNDFHPEERGKRRFRSRNMQDAQVQTETAEQRDTDYPAEKRNCASTATQTVEVGEKSVDVFSQATPPTLQPAPSVDQSLGCPDVLQPLSFTCDKQVCSASCSVCPSKLITATRIGESLFNTPSGITISPTVTPDLSSDILIPPISQINDSTSQRHQEISIDQQLTDFEDSLQDLTQDWTDVDGKGGKSPEKNQANVRMKSLDNVKEMQQMMGSTKISIKVKLRRRKRTKGEEWEVANIQDTNDTMSALTSLDCSNHKRPKTDFSSTPLPPSIIQTGAAQKPDYQFLHPNTAISPKTPTLPSTSHTPLSDCFTPNQSNGLEASSLLHSQVSVEEESDEQIEKLLEDIMMGLNILPDLEKGKDLSNQVQLSPERITTICQGPVRCADSAHGPMHVFYHDSEMQMSSLTDTGIQCCFTSLNQPSCSSLVLDALPVQQQQGRSSWYHSSVRSMWQTDGIGRQNVPLSTTQQCLQSEAPTARSVISPYPVYSTGQKIHASLFQELSAKECQYNHEFLSLRKGNVSQSMNTLFSCWMNDLRLPRNPSLLPLCTSSTNDQTALMNTVKLGDDIQQQPSLLRPPRLTENLGSHIPLSSITHRKTKSITLPQDTNWYSLSKQQQRHPESNQQKRETSATPAEELQERETEISRQQSPSELKSKSGERRKCVNREETITSKRKCTSDPQCTAIYPWTYNDVKVSDAIKSQISLSICQVSLSSNNPLAKERDVSASSSKISFEFFGKPNQPFFITESLREKARQPVVNADQARIRTRATLKKTQESPSDASKDKPMAYMTVNKRVTSNKRGRPRRRVKLTPPNILAAGEKRSHSEEHHWQMDNLPKQDLEKVSKLKQRCEKRKMNSSDLREVPVKKLYIEECSKTDAGNDTLMKLLEQPHNAILKDIKQLIKRRKRSKMRVPQEHPKTNETLRAAESEGPANRVDIEKESTVALNMDVEPTQPLDKNDDSLTLFTVDNNHNHVFNTFAEENNKANGDDTGSSTSKDTCVFADVSDSLEEEMLTAESEQLLENPEEGATSVTGVLNTTWQTTIQDEGLSHSDLPQKNNLQPQMPERIVGPLLDAGRISKTFSCEEEEEVDVLFYSQEDVQTTGNDHHNVEIILDEEEEEDMNEIDVTGD